MNRLAVLLYTLCSTTLAGIGVIIVLVLEQYTARAIIIAAIVGVILAIPATYFVHKQITSRNGTRTS